MSAVLAIFIVLLCAWAAFRLRLLSFDLIPALRHFVVYVALPLFVFGSFIKNPDHVVLDFKIFAVFGLSTLALYAGFAAFGMLKKWPIEHAMLLGYGACASNSLLMGVAILSLAFGNAIAPVVAQIVLFENLILLPLFMVTIDLAKNHTHGLRELLTSIFKNQFVWVVLLAALVNVFAISLPSPVIEAIDFVGKSAAPVAIVCVGGILAQTRPGRYWGYASAASLGKLVILPLIALTLGSFFALPKDTLTIIVLFMAMPNAALFPIFGEQVGLAEFANSTFYLSYIGAFASLALWFHALGV